MAEPQSDPSDFDALMEQIEREAKEEGPEAVAHLRQLQAKHREAVEQISRQRIEKARDALVAFGFLDTYMDTAIALVHGLRLLLREQGYGAEDIDDIFASLRPKMMGGRDEDEAEELAHRAGEFDEAAAMRRRERKDPRYAAVPRLGGGWGVIDYREGRYLEMTERSDEPQQLTAERLARELNASEPTPNLAAIVAEINDWHRYATDPSVDRDARATATLNLGGVMLDHWPAIRAALEQRAERSTNEPRHTHEDVAGGGYNRRCLGCVYEDGFQQGWLASARSRLARSAAAKEGERG